MSWENILKGEWRKTKAIVKDESNKPIEAYVNSQGDWAIDAKNALLLKDITISTGTYWWEYIPERRKLLEVSSWDANETGGWIEIEYEGKMLPVISLKHTLMANVSLDLKEI